VSHLKRSAATEHLLHVAGGHLVHTCGEGETGLDPNCIQLDLADMDEGACDNIPRWYDYSAGVATEVVEVHLNGTYILGMHSDDGTYRRYIEWLPGAYVHYRLWQGAPPVLLRDKHVRVLATVNVKKSTGLIDYFRLRVESTSNLFDQDVMEQVGPPGYAFGDPIPNNVLACPVRPDGRRYYWVAGGTATVAALEECFSCGPAIVATLSEGDVCNPSNCGFAITGTASPGNFSFTNETSDGRSFAGAYLLPNVDVIAGPICTYRLDVAAAGITRLKTYRAPDGGTDSGCNPAHFRGETAGRIMQLVVKIVRVTGLIWQARLSTSSAESDIFAAWAFSNYSGDYYFGNEMPSELTACDSLTRSSQPRNRPLVHSNTLTLSLP